MLCKLYNNGYITVEDISYISPLECGYLTAWYKIYFKSGTILQQNLELDIDRDKGLIYISNNPYITEKLDYDDLRNCSFYKEFKDCYDNLLEKYKESHEKIS